MVSLRQDIHKAKKMLVEKRKNFGALFEMFPFFIVVVI